MSAPLSPTPSPSNPYYVRLKNGWGVQPLGPTSLGGDSHETFKVDKDGNVSGGHTTVRLSGGKSIKLDW